MTAEKYSQRLAPQKDEMVPPNPQNCCAGAGWLGHLRDTDQPPRFSSVGWRGAEY
jgi:hypothetical protein